MSETVREMPKYKCRKEVWALKIKEIRKENVKDHPDHYYRIVLVPEEEGYASIIVTRDYMRRREPQVGGYYIVYGDGGESFLPIEMFEAEYTSL